MGDDSFPRKRSSAGVLVIENDVALVVKPTYQKKWLVPGGIVEVGEAPHVAALRECREEIGIQPQIFRLLVVDYRDSEMGEAIHFLFQGHLDRNATIDIDRQEIERFSWEPLDVLPGMLEEHLSKRVVAAFGAIRRSSTVYCEDGIERFQFRDLRAKSASDDTPEHASKRLGHASPAITERVYRRKAERVKPRR